jgi:hypothetical protein
MKESLQIKKESWFKRLLFDKPITKFVFFAIIYIILIFVLEQTAEDNSIRIPITIIHVILASYLILLMIYVIRHSMKKLTSSKHTRELIGYYVVFLIGIIIILSTVLNLIELSKTGYITYGKCSDHFTPSLVTTDPGRSHSFFYFTAMLFTVGYGDICPMGTAKIFSVITAIIGHVISVVLVALIINNHLRLKDDKE